METTTVLNDKIKSISDRRQFTSFWEAYDYFKLATYSELESLQIASELFDGDAWKNVINASKRLSSDNYAFSFVSGSTYYMGVDPARNTPDPDDVEIEVFVMNNSANPAYMPIYKAYIETRHYKEIPELESQIKIIRTTLTTELAIKLFNNGYKNF
jgi:hypothetical protein